MAEPARRDPSSPDGPPRVVHTGEMGVVQDAADSVTALTSGTRRYRDEGHAKRPPLRIRSWRAYWTTFVVIGGYLWFKFRARFHNDAWIAHTLRSLHLRNA